MSAEFMNCFQERLAALRIDKAFYYDEHRQYAEAPPVGDSFAVDVVDYPLPGAAFVEHWGDHSLSEVVAADRLATTIAAKRGGSTAARVYIGDRITELEFIP